MNIFHLSKTRNRSHISDVKMYTVRSVEFLDLNGQKLMDIFLLLHSPGNSESLQEKGLSVFFGNMTSFCFSSY